MTTTGSQPQLTLDIVPADWQESLRRTLATMGFCSATAYADSQPQKPLSELASELDNPAIAAMQLERQLIEEAETSGTMERCARSLLARDLRAELPEGWPREWTASTDEVGGPLFRRAGVFLSLTMALPEAYALAVERIRRAMMGADIPAGWVPDGAEDLVLVEVFTCFWPAPVAANPNHQPTNATPLE
jgi:hypothetical protein